MGQETNGNGNGEKEEPVYYALDGSSYDTWAHVGDGGAVRDGQGSDALAKELNELPDDANLKCEEQLPFMCLS